MYLGFYGLAKEPFHITPDPDFLFLSPSHKEAFGALIYGVEQRKGFVALTGEVGTGKTTVLRAYLQRIETSAIQPIYLFNPDLTFPQLLALILKGLGSEDEQDKDVPDMLERLHWALIQEYRKMRNVTLIIDEAQNMPMDTLEKLRMLSNLETTADKLIQIVLVGQPELEKKLRDYSLRQLNQRIAVRAKVKALNQRESEEYVQHRLTLAGCARPDVFSPAALRMIIRRAKGNPRVLNIVCDNALANGFGHHAESIGPGIVKEVLNELAPGRRRVPRWVWAAGAAAVLAVFSTLYWQNKPGDPRMPETVPPQNIAHASAPVPAPEPVLTHQESSKEENTPLKVEQDPAKIALDMMQKAISAPVESSNAMQPEALPADTPPAPPAVEAPAPDEPRKIEETVVAKIADPVPDSKPVIPVPVTVPPIPLPEPANPPESPIPAATAVQEKVAPAKIAEIPVSKPEVSTHEEPVAAPAPVEPPVPAITPTEPVKPEPAPNVNPLVADGLGTAPTVGKTQRIVVRGDSLSKLVAQLYGRSSDAMIQEVQKLNPQIQDPDMIIEGDTLVFPVKKDAPKNVDGAPTPPESSNTVSDRSNP